MNISEGYFISFNYKLFYKIIQNNKPQNLILLHGFNDSLYTFHELISDLSEKFNLYMFDFRGHGNSEHQLDHLYHFANNIVDLQVFINQFLPEKFCLLGHSMGAGIASRYAGLFPERVQLLICLEGFGSLKNLNLERERIRKWLSNVKNLNSKQKITKKFKSLNDVMEKLKHLYVSVTTEKLLSISSFLTSEKENYYFWKSDPYLKNSFPSFFPQDLTRNLWSNITCPVLVLFGDNTSLELDDPKEVFSHFKNVEILRIKNAVHNIHQDQHYDVICVINKFIENKML